MNDLTAQQYVEMLSILAAKNTQLEVTIAELQVRLGAAQPAAQEGTTD
ncbi:hypothetical protein OH783_01485 [Kocuria rhizophila]|nr:hypothetical protein OH783_01485 [Kocuria rhizophila]WSZ54109.1 hypothetical protein OG926_01490 [Kocuria rhizophila]